MHAINKDRGFSTLFTEAISSTLGEILGETASEALIYHLEGQKGPVDAAPLHDNLRRVVGTASGIIEKLVARKLAKGLGMSLDESRAFDFVGSVEHLREEFTRERGGASMP